MASPTRCRSTHGSYLPTAPHGKALVGEPYERHRPETTVLHALLSAHWQQFLERSEDGGGLPRFVVREVEEYLRCGLLEHGCIRVGCPCGFERLVAFSCKRRGFCPSCIGRLRLNPHFHTLALDGVYVRDLGGQLRFEALPPPTEHEVEHVARRTAERLIALLKRHGRDVDGELGALVHDDELTQEQPALKAADERKLKKLRAICMALPDANEKISHGEPTWFAGKGKVFAMFDNHHHDSEHIAVWLPLPTGMQEMLIELDSSRYFRPPYVGTRGGWRWCSMANPTGTRSPTWCARRFYTWRASACRRAF